MDCNISVTCQSHEDRWRWVHRGIETLVDAIRMNPNDPMVYYQLAWIYCHKLGNTLDEAQQYYKVQFAKQMLEIFGGEHYPDWEALAAAPETEQEFREQYPKDNPIWTAIGRSGFDSLDEVEKAFQRMGRLPEGLTENLSEKEAKDLTNFFRNKWLKSRFLIDSSIIAEIEKEYGELDWCLPESFAIYWAYQGIQHSPDR